MCTCVYIYIYIYTYPYAQPGETGRRRAERPRLADLGEADPLCPHLRAYIGMLKPVMCFFEPRQFDEVCDRIPPTSQTMCVSLSLYIYIYIYCIAYYTYIYIYIYMCPSR